jgi:hypothetical protein
MLPWPAARTGARPTFLDIVKYALEDLHLLSPKIRQAITHVGQEAFITKRDTTKQELLRIAALIAQETSDHYLRRQLKRRILKKLKSYI